MRSQPIPAPAVRRLSLYLRQLEQLRHGGRTTVSSRALAEALHLTAAQVRKDLAWFGQFGQPGKGYDVEALAARLRRILGTDRTVNVVVVGAGNLGRALLQHKGFLRKGFRIVAAFDTDGRTVGQAFGGIIVQPLSHLESTLAAQDVRLAILTTPAEAAQSTCQRLAEAGVRGVLNFAPVALAAPAPLAVVSVDLTVQLEQLSFLVHSQTDGPADDLDAENPSRSARV